MRPVIIGLATFLAAGAALAQTSPPGAAPATSGTSATSGTANATATSGTPAATSNANGASGNDNQAVATTNANAAMPAHGHNSFTKGEARRRIQSEGFTKVVGLRKDEGGVWRGTATKDGQSTSVWLDYKGNVGTAG